MEGDASEREHLPGKYTGTSPGLDALWSRLKQEDIGRDRCCITWRWTVNDRAAHPRCPMVAPPQLQDTSLQSMTATKDAWATYLKSLEELLEELTAQEASAKDPNVNTEIGKQIGALRSHLFQASSRQNIAAYSLGVKRDQEQLQTWRQRGDFHLAERDPESSYFHVWCDGEQYEPSCTSGDNHQGVPHHVGGGRVQVLHARHFRLPPRHEGSR